MNETIESAILQHQALRFTYEGKVRIVEPFCYGADSAGEHTLHAYQVSGYSDESPPIGWRSFAVSKMQDIAMANLRFEIRPEYAPDDPEMSKIFCKIR